MRATLSTWVVIVLVGCGRADGDAGQGKPSPGGPTEAGGATATAQAATAKAPGGFAPEPLTVAELAPVLPKIEGAREIKALYAMGPAVLYDACLDGDDAMKAAEMVMEKFLGAGWESMKPRQTAQPEVVALDVRKRPYLCRVTLRHGTEAAADGGAPADGGAGGPDACALTSQVKLSYFISKNDASFAARGAP